MVLTENSQVRKFLITKKENLGITSCGLPIEHYTIGTGDKHIVIMGAMHGSEIISTDFVLQLMEKMSIGDERFKFLESGNYTIDFIPMANPEGYLITTTAVRKLIPRDMPKNQAEKICHEYWGKFRKDDQEAIKERKEDPEKAKELHYDIKQHQKMFSNVTWEDIPDKYKKVKEKIKKLHEEYEIPIGAMATWSANADGIDLNSNNKYNSHISDIEQGKQIPNNLRYNNINMSLPGPIGCPYNINEGFKKTNENVAIESFF